MATSAPAPIDDASTLRELQHIAFKTLVAAMQKLGSSPERYTLLGTALLDLLEHENVTVVVAESQGPQ